jgi:hypothetical protein
VKKKNRLLDLIRHAHETEMNFIDGFSSQELAQIGTLDDWSVKDVIAHITARKALMADGLLAISEARDPIGSDDLHHENVVLYKEYQDKTWEEVLRYSNDTFQRVVAQVITMEDKDLEKCGKFFPWQSERPLWRLIIGSSAIHPIGHISEFSINHGNRERAGRMMGDMAKAMADLDNGPEWKGEIKYNLACYYSLLGEKAKAIRILMDSLLLNPKLINMAREDPDLEAIRNEPEYRVIIKD